MELKKFPDDRTLQIMWTVATSSAIEDGARKPYEIFARLLYNDITNTKLKVNGIDVTLGDKK